MLPGVEPLDSTHDDMMMLWSVLADAGPRTGDGDVSAISPTVDDGAGSMMFRFEPTRVAGFDFEFKCQPLNFSSPRNSTGECQSCTIGAHEVNVQLPEAPLYPIYEPYAVAGFDFELGSTTMIFSTSLNSTGACQPVPSISHDVLAAICGLNNNQKDYCRDCCLSNYQEEQDTGRWRWIMPSIVTVVLLGDLSTMRRWFGGSGYGIPINHLLGLFLFLIFVPTTSAVTCRTCFDQIQGCTGGDTCPFVATAAQNGMLLGGVAAATATVIVARDVFPLRFTRILTRGVLDSLLIIGRRPPPGTAVDLTALTNAQLTDPLQTSGVEPASILDEVTTRLAAATTQIEIQRLNAMCTAITAKQRLGRGAHGAVASGDGTAELVGVYRYCAVLASKVVRTRLSQVASILPPDAAQGLDAHAKVVPPEKIVKPKSMAEFSDVLMTWTMLLSGLGIASILVSGAFLREVVYDPIADGTVTWEGAFELWLVYLEEVERTAGDEVNLANVYNRGAQDTMLKRAMERLPFRTSTGIFRGNGGNGDGGEGPKWNGSFNSKSAGTCLTFNLGKKQHPATCLNEKGGCKFNHVCDAFVGDKGPGGRCGSDKHGRQNCDNPAKQSTEQK